MPLSRLFTSKDESCVQQGKLVNISPWPCESRLAPENFTVYSAVTPVQTDCGWHPECCTLVHHFKVTALCSLVSVLRGSKAGLSYPG